MSFVVIVMASLVFGAGARTVVVSFNLISTIV